MTNYIYSPTCSTSYFFSFTFSLFLFVHYLFFFFFFSSRRRHTRYWRDWSSALPISTANILKTAAALGVSALWVPLMGAGLASQGGKFGPQQSLESILGAVAAWEGPGRPMKVIVV